MILSSVPASAEKTENKETIQRETIRHKEKRDDIERKETIQRKNKKRENRRYREKRDDIEKEEKERKDTTYSQREKRRYIEKRDDIERKEEQVVPAHAACRGAEVGDL